MIYSILKSSFVRACAAASLLGLAGYSPLLKASNFTVAGIEVQGPQAMATSAGQPNGAIFIEAISNKAGKADRLVAARSPVSASMELHNMTMDGGVMRMREIAGIDLPAGGKVLMHRGSKEGYHLMLMGLKKPLEAGQVIPVTLIFERAGELEVKASVVDMRAKGHGGHHGGSGGMHHKH
jgi:copper(I)-binding protein